MAFLDSTENVQSSRSRTEARRPRLTTFATAIFILAAVSTFLMAAIRKSGQAPSILCSWEPMEISLSHILPRANQRIVIQGSGFGFFLCDIRTPISPFLAIRDKTAGWATGRIFAQNWDEVMLSIDSWQDKQIVVSGFSGAYGFGDWKLSPGDKVEIAIWNPQSGRGPAVYHLAVSTQSAE